MTELYKEVEEIAMFEVDREEELRTEKFCDFLKATRWIYLFSIVLTVTVTVWWTFSQQNLIFALFIIAMIFCLVGISLYIKHFMKQLFDLQFHACNMKKALTVYLVMLRHTKKTEKSDAGLYGIGSGLLCMGEFEKALEIAKLIEKHCDTATAKVYALIIRSSVAFNRKEKENLESCITLLAQMASQNQTPFVTDSYSNVSKSMEILKLEESLDYAGALQLFSQEEYNREMFSKVSASYCLYRIAKGAGMEQEAAQHKEFVIVNGGDSFYRKRIENE